jgi:hypothetical protein
MKTLTLAVAVAALVLAAAASAGTTTLRLTEKQTFQDYVDKGRKGESRGDIRIFGGTLFEHGKKVGHDRIHCVVGGTCDAQAWLPGGMLVSKGFVPGGPRFTAPVTGGTGRFSGAHGTIAIVGGPVTHNTIRLVR